MFLAFKKVLADQAAMRLTAGVLQADRSTSERVVEEPTVSAGSLHHDADQLTPPKKRRGESNRETAIRLSLTNPYDTKKRYYDKNNYSIKGRVHRSAFSVLRCHYFPLFS